MISVLQNDVVSLSKMVARGVLCLAAIILSGSAFPPHGDPPGAPHPASTIIVPGEELVYEVSYLSIHLGQVHFKIVSTDDTDGSPQYTVASFIDSYEGVPFIGLHAIQYSTIDSKLFSIGFHSFEKNDDQQWIGERTLPFDRKHQSLVLEKTLHAAIGSPSIRPPTFDTLNVERSPFHDGLSIFYYTRAHIHDTDTLDIPTVVRGKMGSTMLWYNSTPTSLELDAFRHPVRVIECNGKANFKGLFGFTGEFKGWLSDDAASVPIKAEMQVVLGSVTVELVSWKRKGWKIPYIDEAPSTSRKE